VLGQLGWRLYPEVEPEQAEVDGHRLQAVRASVQKTHLVACWRDRPDIRPDPRLNGRCRRVHGYPRPVPPPGGRDARRYPHREIVGRQRPGNEPAAAGRPQADPVDAERPPVAGTCVEGHEVPAPPPVHQLVRLRFAVAARTVMGHVREPQPLPEPAGRRDRGEHVRVHQGPGDAGHGRDDRLQRAHPVPQPGRQHLLELAERPQRRLLDPGDRAARRCPQPDGDRDGLLVVEQQRRHRGPRAEPVTPGRTPRGEHWIPQLTQLLHVVPNSPRRHPQPRTQLGAGPLARGLQQRKQPQQPRRRLPHGFQSAAILGTESS
jgi:hypothetical protein